MGNIWGILLQTVTVSLTAGLLLLLKGLMADKLSPRWQYGVWPSLVISSRPQESLSRRPMGKMRSL